MFLMKLLCLFMVSFLSKSFKIASQEASELERPFIAVEQSSLGFSNTKGIHLTNDHLMSFKAFAGNASIFFGASVLDNLNYITTQMNNTYGMPFSVLLQTSPDVFTNFNVNSVLGESYASLAPGSNIIQPKWSYLFFAGRGFNLPYVFIGGLGQGTGFTSSEIDTITNSAMFADGP